MKGPFAAAVLVIGLTRGCHSEPPERSEDGEESPAYGATVARTRGIPLRASPARNDRVDSDLRDRPDTRLQSRAR
jgi:hypothetical protein